MAREKADMASVRAHRPLGQRPDCRGALAQALGEKRGITRFADATVPMDESLCRAALDLSGRGSLHARIEFPTASVGEFDVELVEEFLGAFFKQAGINGHVDVLRGTNSHHVAEAVFKAVARALRAAVETDPRKGDAIPSTKGAL
ncbi:MAG: hypothetical protein ACOCP9_03395 [Halofilum sp. (in: g-proteobacteria)]